MSTSKDREVTSRFGTKYQFVIKSKTGVVLANLSEIAAESEVLFQPNTPFKVTKVETSKNGTIFYLEEL